MLRNSFFFNRTHEARPARSLAKGKGVDSEVIRPGGSIEVQDRPNEDGTAYGDAAALAAAHLKMYEELQADTEGRSVIPDIKSKILSSFPNKICCFKSYI